jgi:hypothetical protein
MVNNPYLNSISSTVSAYIAITVATVLTLVAMSIADPHLATSHAWGHALIVVVFAVLLPLRVRSARAGKRSGLRAVGLISATLLVINMAEGLIPGFFPAWMRVEMFCIAGLMAVIVLLVVRTALALDQR